MIYVFGDISGSHVNPSVTIAPLKENLHQKKKLYSIFLNKSLELLRQVGC
ncbi:aquaporin [Gillisia hiemivivida]